MMEYFSANAYRIPKSNVIPFVQTWFSLQDVFFARFVCLHFSIAIRNSEHVNYNLLMCIYVYDLKFHYS